MASCGADCRVVIQKENPQTRVWEVLYVDDQNTSVIRSVSFTNSPGSPPSDQYQMSALRPTSGVGLHLAAACLDGTVVVLSLQADHNWKKMTFQAHLGAAYVARWSGLEYGQASDDLMNPGRRLASGGQDGEVHVYIYDGNTYILEQALQGHKRPIVDIAWMPPNDTREERIASLGDDGTTIIWTKPHNGHWSKAQMKPKAAPGSHHLGWSFDGSCIALSLKDGQPPLKLL
ncbi:putative transport protein SEC13 [Gregarina niphandrodes]|uniref:Transport protein SEC13 n=1 Tax=Gregarina niphandrodes TaxID=110365 RepID=A0A023B7H3_GRENI|nr:putative transport protein SEC13 [Gregarina niphandrodes]EZG67409.1 putative transport protein SEC13 [Gregarina niphandrodes]|eukprot:XP_011130242.1 putative transport protein SEC13 [Gregarina niphandrodes]